MSPYSSEEIVTRQFIIGEKPTGIINIVDATNIERNLYLTMQLMELDTPMVLALNMMDEVRGNGGTVRINKMEAMLGIPVIPISAAKNEGVDELVDHALHVAKYQERPGRMDFCSEDDHGGAVHRCIHGIIHLINSGSCCLDATGRQSENGQPVMKPFWEITEAEAEACLGATTWYPASREYMRGGGYSSCFLTQGDMPVTMCRLNLIKGQGPVLQIAEGWAVNVDREIFETINRRTDKTWPTTWFAPRLTGKGAFRDVYSVMNSWGANHGAISYGHIGADLVTLASMLRIPVCMHNLDETGLFRPSAWAAFGMDPEGADYRACENYGPIYR